ncbi:hypothetical protein KY290_036732 [Solanum tuberosum]|uniref:Uncharacterized protein n=1 Tax=Solanum tuberosum TaxID=4113 RepID=A0ABQ7TTK6_SOLTU|nr:hypothetical protein KY289_036219 [Solanum tuberosum]KAH0639462.1 hypothetical protein KY285_036048 [Solanum tuberosum]KAH0738027.1 hypothetical protein KY290_036732 [Solanum tuberosum]
MIEEEVHDVCPPRAPHLVCHLVDVTKTKAQEASHGPVLSTADRQAHDDSWMGRMYGMAELQLQIGGRSVTKEDMATLTKCYPLTDSAIFMCRMGPAFQEPIDDDDATEDEDDKSEEDETDDGRNDDDDDDDDTDAGDGEAALMVVDFAQMWQLLIECQEA